MSIAIYTIKGGVGKTTLSVQASQMLNYTYVTNDAHASVHDLMDEEKSFLVSATEFDEIPFDESIIYDFGGFKDNRIKSILEKVDKVVIPTLTSMADIKGTLATLKEVVEFNKNIILVINRSKSDNKAKELKEYLEEEVNKIDNSLNINYLLVRESSALQDSLFDCESIETKAGQNKFKRHIYRNAIEDMSEFKRMLEDK